MRANTSTHTQGNGQPEHDTRIPQRRAVAGCLLALALACPPAAFADAAQAAETPTVTLEQCVEEAMKTGPDVRVSEAAVAAARAQYAAAEAENRLGLSGSASLAHSKETSRTGDSVPVDSLKAGATLTAPLSSSVSLSATQGVDETGWSPSDMDVSLSASATVWDGYLGGSALASTRQASFSLQQTLLAEEANRKAIIYGVKQAYYTMLAQQREIGILTQTLDQRREETRKTQALHESGNANQIDVRQAQVNLTSAELDLRKAQGNLEIDRENLSVLVGWPTEKVYSAAETADLPAPDMDVAQAVKTALDQRADLKQYAAKIASAVIDVDLARAKRSPTVSASAGLGFTQPWDGSTATLDWSGGVQVSMPILDSGAADAAVRRAQAAGGSITVQRDKLAAAIATEVKNAVYGLRDLLARVDLAGEKVDLAQSQYDLARMQFENGSGSNLDVLEASVTLSTAQVSLAKARSDAQLGVLALQDAMGL
jgi:outer membrane protein TolC